MAITNNLLKNNEALMAEWNVEKNSGTDLETLTTNSQKKVWWRCKTNPNHEWQARVADRTLGKGCPICTGKKVLAGFNDLQTRNPEIAKQWHPTKNGDLTPSDVTPASNKKAWWICEFGHEWQAMVYSRTMGTGCPYCASKKVLVEFNDLKTTNPELAKQWHPTKNGDLKPSEVTPSSNKKAWWICEFGHEWQATISDRTKGRGCPICMGKKVLSGFNDLASKNPEIAKEWHPTKNGDLTPSDVSPGSNKKIWWICEQGHEWQAGVYSRVAGSGCPECAKLNRKKNEKK